VAGVAAAGVAAAGVAAAGGSAPVSTPTGVVGAALAATAKLYAMLLSLGDTLSRNGAIPAHVAAMATSAAAFGPMASGSLPSEARAQLVPTYTMTPVPAALTAGFQAALAGATAAAAGAMRAIAAPTATNGLALAGPAKAVGALAPALNAILALGDALGTLLSTTLAEYARVVTPVLDARAQIGHVGFGTPILLNIAEMAVQANWWRLVPAIQESTGAVRADIAALAAAADALAAQADVVTRASNAMSGL
jgi:hypothetical protein